MRTAAWRCATRPTLSHSLASSRRQASRIPTASIGRLTTSALWLRFDRHGDPYEISFETFDLLADTASNDPQLNARLNTLEDPSDQASAIGEALYAALHPQHHEYSDYLE